MSEIFTFFIKSALRLKGIYYEQIKTFNFYRRGYRNYNSF